MKQPKKPTLAQKKRLAAAGLNWRSWSILREEGKELHIVNKRSGRSRTLKES